MKDILFLLIEIGILFLISRFLTYQLFAFLFKLTHSHKLSFRLMALVYLPGTFVHEMSHLIMAQVLLLRVNGFSLWPEVDGNEIKLGHVSYRKADFLRSIIVGIAPFIGGIAFFYGLFYFQLFPSSIWYMNILLGYLILTVALNMFSSRQDLIDLIYLLPVVIMIIIISYIFSIDYSFIFSHGNVTHYLLGFIQQITIYYKYVCSIGIIAFILLKILNKTK